MRPRWTSRPPHLSGVGSGVEGDRFKPKSRIKTQVVGLIIAVGVLFVLWSQTTHTPPTEPSTAVPRASAEPGVTTTPTGANWQLNYPLTPPELAAAADTAVAYLEFVGTYSPKTDPNTWREQLLKFYPPTSRTSHYIEGEPDWTLIQETQSTVTTTITSVEVIAVRIGSVTLKVDTTTTPVGQDKTVITLVLSAGHWTIDGLHRATGGEQGIGT